MGSGRKITHGFRYTRFYNIWKRMKDRCNNQNNIDYHRYGGRGIKVCDSWTSNFENFRDDMYESYLCHSEINGEKNTSIDRIDTNGNYCKENCKWSTPQEQRLNQRQSRNSLKKFEAVSPDGEIFICHNRAEFCRQNNLQSSSIWKCLNKKMKKHRRWTFKYLD
jgi:hypothetical protein